MLRRRHRHRPRSPLSLETVSPQATDLDTDGIIGSDDELDEAARESQRRRIEELADSYRQGHPLFILSASLRGPLDKGWENPWRKNRKRKSNPSYNLDGLHAQAEKPEGPAVQGTDPRKQRSDESSRSCRHRRPDSAYASPTCDTEPPTSLDHHRLPTPRRDERSRSSQSRVKRPRSVPGEEDLTQVSSPVYSQSNDGWLKKDRTFPYMNYIDPPSSPTRAFSTLHPRANPLKRRLIADPSIRRISSPKSQDSSMTIQKESSHLAADKLNSIRRSESVNVNHSSDTAGTFSRGQRISHPGFSDGTRESLNPEASFVLSSSSHLPKLDYRRRKKSESSKKGRSKSSPIVKEKHAEERYSHSNTPAHTINYGHPGSSDRITHKEAISGIRDDNPIEGDNQPSIDNGIHGSCQAKRITSISTGEETAENLPSAQQLPKNLSITDYETSLHSTAVPKRNPKQDGDTNPQAQLSTQAAALLAQKSFQIDIDTPKQVQTTSKRNRHSSQSPHHSHSHPGSITPFYKLYGQSNEAEVSTQHMIYATTPFTTSTGKNSNGRSGTSTKSKSGNKKHKNASFAISSQNVSPSPENGALTPPVGAESGSDLDEMPREAINHRPDSQLTALPFTLTGSTPPTAQNAQWADSTDGFNLNQAIADAGSWLQQTSFDLNNELKQYSKTAPSSSAEARRSALSLDTVS